MFGFKKKAKTPEPLKLCKECKHCDTNVFYPKCLHNESLENGLDMTLVTGDKYYGGMYRSCWLMRGPYFPCGKNAKLFEPKGDTDATNT